MNPTRRKFLQGLGTAAAAAPLLPLMEAHAQGEAFPTRLILLFSPNGTLYENWAPTGTETNFTLSPILAPLAAHQDELVILDEVRRSTEGVGGAHQRGIAALWSGARIQPGSLFPTQNSGEYTGWGGGISVDQFLANQQAGETLYNSLEFGAFTGAPDIMSRMSYSGPGAPVPPESDPQAMFDRVFGDFTGGGMDQLREERRSVLDAVAGHLTALAPKISAADAIKLEAHLDGIRELERRNELALPTCDPSSVEPGAIDPEMPGAFGLVSRAHIDQMVMAMSCDVTRIASLQWSRAVSQLRFGWLGHTQTHHDISHLGDSDPAMTSQITDINVWYATEVAYLLDALAAVPEGSGTMLDNTLVVWGNELGRGNNHSETRIPFVLAGGAGGAIETGRWLQRGVQFHNRLLVSICHAMGQTEVDTFGDADPGNGGFPDLVGSA